MNDDTLLNAAYCAFDAANSADPNSIEVGGELRPKELVFAQRLTDMLHEIEPEPSMALKLAARCQHICRWEVPRNTQPMGRAGYLKWREGLKKYHAQRAGEILRAVGAPDEIISRVQELNLKKNLKNDAECQTLEDALCLVFLKYQFDALIEGTEEEKMLRIIKKTWDKMSARGQQEAAQLEYSRLAADLLGRSID